jgi:hypothetical protein
MVSTLSMLPADHEVKQILNAIKLINSSTAALGPLSASKVEALFAFVPSVFKRLYELRLSEPLRLESYVSILEGINECCGYDFDAMSGTKATSKAISVVTSKFDDLDLDDNSDWGDDLDLGDDGAYPAYKTSKKSTYEMASVSDMDKADGGFEMPTSRRPSAACWIANSSHAAVHIAAGQAASAMQLLNTQIAVSDFFKLKNAMIGCFLGSSDILLSI